MNIKLLECGGEGGIMVRTTETTPDVRPITCFVLDLIELDYNGF